jgi:hypothetical protein
VSSLSSSSPSSSVVVVRRRLGLQILSYHRGVAPEFAAWRSHQQQ